jgi:ethanolamine utilization microcompartment shell protein EutS
MSNYRRGFALDIGFIDNFNTQLVITLNYSAIDDLHTLQIIVTHISVLNQLVDVS